MYLQAHQIYSGREDKCSRFHRETISVQGNRARVSIDSDKKQDMFQNERTLSNF